MKLHSKPTYYLSILSLGIILFLIGLIALIGLHGQRISSYLKQQQNIVLDLDDSSLETQRDTILNFLRSKQEIKNESIKFVGREEGLLLMQQELNEPNLFLDMENPLQDIIQFQLGSGKVDIEQLDKLKLELTNLPGVVGMHFQKDPYLSLDNLRSQINIILLSIIVLMTIFSLVLIYNTIRLMLISQRKRIFTMQMVGARDRFIKKPYLRIGASIGFWAGVVSALFLFISYLLFKQYFSLPSGFVNFSFIALIMLGMLIAGFVFALLCSYIIVNKFLSTIEK